MTSLEEENMKVLSGKYGELGKKGGHLEANVKAIVENDTTFLYLSYH